MIKSNGDIFTAALYSEFNRSLESNVFAPTIKLTNVILFHKKGNHLEKDKSRSVSILPNLTKVFERCIYDQIVQFLDKIVSN